MNQTTRVKGRQRQTYYSSYSNSPISARQLSSDSESLGHTTIDGGVLTYRACEQAVSNGSGILIGGYFVGVTEASNSLNHMPLLRY
ncbi:hypothetical protein [Pontibacter beigongshangensis]|uniref:hypothetical protein n=1 Tax=Pontibacter beigongshangensis TaxID=2574733 RepID=UPI001650B865|nr:hypothetical protein [Pontibacter beigongshangensis]